MTKRGFFVSFEGGDGCGKTTQMRLLVERLKGMGLDVLETAEPGGTPIGRQIRKILLDSANQELSARAELLLYFACRAQNVDEWIRPALEAGRVVVSDRFTDSTLAYQGEGRGLTAGLVRELHGIACQEVLPDLTIYLDIDYKAGLARARARNAEREAAALADETRMDEQAEEFHARVRQGYLALAAAEPRRIRTIDAGQSVAAVAAAIWSEVGPHV
jgi:dTMP kinase